MDWSVSRREFLKASALTSAAILLGDATASIGSAEEAAPPSADTGIQRFRNVCPRNCHDTCGLITEVQNGRVIRAYGDPNHPITQGAVCLKGATYAKQIYHPDRQLYPMKRVGAKGEGKWQRIGWQEAIEIITNQFKSIVQNYGGEAILPYWYSGTLGAVTNYSMNYRFWYKLGACNLEQTVCASAGGTGIGYTLGTTDAGDPQDFANTKLMVSWGINEQATNPHAFLVYEKAFRNGAKYVVVNPYKTEAAQMADIHIQPRPGTDGALALGMMNVIISENLYDADYVSKNTVGFDELKKRVADYSVDTVSAITDVPAQQIVDFARLYATTKPAAIKVGFGMQRNSNGGSMVRAITCLPGLTGQIGKPGAGVTYINGGWPWNWGKLYAFDAPKTRTINMNRLGEELLSAKPPIKALYVYNSHPGAQCPNLNKVYQGLKREDLFTVVHDLFLTDTADYADVFLPATHFFEQWDLNQAYWGWVAEINEKAVEPAGEARSNDQVFRDLAAGMGFTDPVFQEDSVSLIKTALDITDPLYKGLTFDNLLSNGAMHLATPEIPYILFKDGKFPTPSGKVEFYSDKAKKDGFDPLPIYVAPVESRDGSPDLHAKYPLVLLTSATKNLLSSQWSNDPTIQELDPVRHVVINPDDAASRGISGGDQVTVKNDRGSVQLAAVISDSVKPGVAFSEKCWWPKLCPDGKNINFLTSDRLADMGNCSTYHTNLVQIEKA
jgi:anaerobic selenocysteine-containing dehydrogenase